MVLSLGRARPMLAAMRRCASFVEFSLMTVKATCPGFMCFKPSLREINLQLGGKIEETRTMLQAAIPALRRASSKLESLSRCLPTPLVRKIFFATNAMVPVCRASVRGVSAKNFLLWKNSKKVLQCQRLSQAKAMRRQKYEYGVTMRAKRNHSPSGALEHLAERHARRGSSSGFSRHRAKKISNSSRAQKKQSNLHPWKHLPILSCRDLSSLLRICSA